MHMKVALIGLGNVNRNLLNILVLKKERLLQEHGVEFQIVLIADSSGVASNAEGYDPATVLAAKEAGTPVLDMAGALPGQSVTEVLSNTACDLVFEASPVDLKTGGPGLAVARAALSNGMSVVLANKGPIVLAFEELHQLAAEKGVGLKYSATVCGGLPILNIGTRDMITADITKLRGIFNSTSNFILDEMAEGRSYDDALAETQRRGIAEADPSLDVGGWDTANKLLLIVNTILGANITLKDIDVTGVTDITPEYLRTEKDKGNVVKLVASAEGGNYSVSPMALPETDFLAHCSGWEMGVEMHTDIYGINYHKLWEREPTPTAASMLRDAVHIFAERQK